MPEDMTIVTKHKPVLHALNDNGGSLCQLQLDDNMNQYMAYPRPVYSPSHEGDPEEYNNPLNLGKSTAGFVSRFNNKVEVYDYCLICAGRAGIVFMPHHKTELVEYAIRRCLGLVED